MNSPLLLAVDGGNSKTDVALFSIAGELLAAVRGPGSSPHHIGLDGSMALIDGLVDMACTDAHIARNGSHFASVGAWYIAGADLPSEERALRRAIEQLGLAAHNHVANDTFAILRAGCDDGWGVAVVVGAGINCVGLSPSGRSARFPALGDVTGDWGGGPDVGLAALGAAIRAEDGRGEPTALRAAVAAHFGTRRATDVAIAIHQERIARDRLLELAPLVFDVAASGDLLARAILDHQADEVVRLAGAALRRLRLTSLDVTVVLGGGISLAFPHYLVDDIETAIKETAPRVHCVVSRERPIVGAALSALDIAGGSQRSTRRLRAALHEGSIREIRE
jgi:N-acetylglucosamine kinase-like BadF-type ATPase